MKNILLELEKHVYGNSTLEELEVWVVANLQRILDSGDMAAIDLANEIDADIIEYIAGAIDHDELQKHLLELLQTGKILEQAYKEIPDAIPLRTAREFNLVLAGRK